MGFDKRVDSSFDKGNLSLKQSKKSSKKKKHCEDRESVHEEPASPKKLLKTPKSSKKHKLLNDASAPKPLSKKTTKETSDESSDEEYFETKNQTKSKSDRSKSAGTSNDENLDIVEDSEMWPSDDINELISQIENILPKIDNIAYKSRAESLEWEKVAFKTYSAQQCRIMWDIISKKIRGFRILREVLQDAKEWATEPWKDFYKRKANNRHPEMPRRPLSSYMLYFTHMHEKLKNENSKMELTVLTKHISELYRKLSDEKKKKYVAKAAAARAEYEKEMERFYAKHPELKVEPKSKPKSKNTENVSDKPPLPTKPLPPFKLFYEDRLQYENQVSDFDKVAFHTHCREIWNKMNEEKKGVWINWSLQQEEKYNKAMQTYQLENPEYVGPITSTKSTLNKEEVAIRNRLLGKPDKPPNSAYSLFSTLLLGSDELKTAAPKDRMLLISQQWRNLNSDEKKTYEERVAHLKECYKLEYAAYLESLSPDKRDLELQSEKKKPVKKKKPDDDDEEAVNNANSKKKKQKIEKKQIDTLKTLFKGEPEAPPIHASLLYAKTYRGNPSTVQAAWKSLTVKTQNKYRRKLDKLKQQYMAEYEIFLKGLNEEQLQEYSNVMKFRNGETEEAQSSTSEDEEEPQQEVEDQDSSSEEEESDSSDDE